MNICLTAPLFANFIFLPHPQFVLGNVRGNIPLTSIPSVYPRSRLGLASHPCVHLPTQARLIYLLVPGNNSNVAYLVIANLFTMIASFYLLLTLTKSYRVFYINLRFLWRFIPSSYRDNLCAPTCDPSYSLLVPYEPHHQV